MSKLKLKNFFRGKNKNNSLTEHIFFNLKNHPTYHSEARLVNLFTVRARWCFEWCIYIFSFCSVCRQWELENGEGQSASSMNHTGHETALLAAMVRITE